MNADETSDIGPSGLGGWLLLIPVGLASGVFRTSGFVLMTVIPLVSEDTWHRLMSPPEYHPLLMPLLLFQVLANFLFALASLALLYLFFRRSRRFPRALVTYLSLNVVYLVIVRLLGGFVPAMAEVLETRAAWIDLAVALVVAAIWIPYIFRSRRVSNTFRVDSNELATSQTAYRN